MRRILTSAVLLTIVSAASGQTTRVSVDSSGGQGNGFSDECAISADGTTVAFASDATNLVAGDTNNVRDVFVHTVNDGTTVCVSVDAGGVPGNNKSYGPSISADGRFVCFSSYATNLVAGDTNGAADVFVRDMTTGVTERISVDPTGGNANSYSYDAKISADGNFVAFTSGASNLVPGYGGSQVYRRDRANAVTLPISVDDAMVQGDNWSQYPAISADGNVVAFSSVATNLVAGDTNGKQDVFARDVANGTTELVSVDSSGAQADDGSAIDGWIAVSDDGSRVAFPSYASNLVAGDTANTGDVFVRDRAAGTTICASLDPSGAFTGSWNQYPAISGDGRFVTFQSWAQTLVAGDANGYPDIFVRDLVTSTTWLVSVDSNGVQADRESRYPSISKDGSAIAFVGYATNLVPGDTNIAPDVFVRDECPATWSLYGSGFPGTLGVPDIALSGPPALGATVDLSFDNSAGQLTIALLLADASAADIVLGSGAHVLVIPSLIVPTSLPSTGASLTFTIPNDPSLCGFSYFFQVGELDLGAIARKSFTQGLQMTIGL